MKLVVVITRNHKQFEIHGAEKARDGRYWEKRPGELVVDDTRYLYISEPIRLMGLRDFEVERWGEWFKRPDIEDMEYQIKLRQRS